MLLLSLVTYYFYSITSAGSTPYDYFTRLADALLHGKYYLETQEPWLNELIPIANDHYAVVYPPAPAVAAIPFMLIFGPNFQQQILSWIMGSLAAFLWGLIAFQKSGNKLTSFWVFLLSAFGNIVWYMSATGSVWYLGQVSAYLFLTLTIYESLNKKRIPIIALYFGLAVLSRLQVVLAFPLVFYLIHKELRNKINFFVFFLETVFFGLLYGIYNYLRFGSFFQTGYSLIPGVLEEPWFDKGIFNISYVSNNIKTMFASYPIFSRDPLFIKPSWGGLAIWITSPTFIYMFWNNIKKLDNLTAYLSIILIGTVVMCHGTTGFAQFGYRFAVDFYPLIFYLVVNSVSKTGVKWHHWTLLVLSIIVNTWGVIFINKFGWISY